MSTLKRVVLRKKIDINFAGVSGYFRWNTIGITELSAPTSSLKSGLHFDSSDTLYIADESGDRVVWKLPQAENQLAIPRYFTFDSTETCVYVADSGNH